MSIYRTSRSAVTPHAENEHDRARERNIPQAPGILGRATIGFDSDIQYPKSKLSVMGLFLLVEAGGKSRESDDPLETSRDEIRTLRSFRVCFFFIPLIFFALLL